MRPHVGPRWVEIIPQGYPCHESRRLTARRDAVKYAVIRPGWIPIVAEREAAASHQNTALA
eukprot:5716310-Pyramimonas_sp.AAC.1